MTKQFHAQIDAVRDRVVKMGELARRNLLEGVQSFASLDPNLAAAVVARDAEANRFDVEIERDALELLARHQPMATDLRTLGAVLKIITYLDRVSRYGYDIAKATQALHGKEHVRKLITIPHMAEIAASMVEEAVAAFRDHDAAKARGIAKKDELVDALYEQTFRECVTYMIEDPRNITTCAHYILVARHLERVGDNATKIAEKTIYMTTGERRLKL